MKNTTLTFLDRGWNAEFAERADVLVELLRTNYTLAHLKWEGFWPLNEEGTKLVYEAMKCNGSILTFPGFCANMKHLCFRNEVRQIWARASVVSFLALRRFRNTTLNDTPKEVVTMIAVHIWGSRVDVIVWKTLERYPLMN